MKKVFLLLALLASFLFWPVFAYSQNVSDQYKAKQKEIEELEVKISQLQTQEKTLSSQIAFMDNQIKLTTLRIAQTEEEIATLIAKISRLEVSLDFLATVLGKRISATYKRGEVDPVALFLSSKGFSDFVRRYKYLKVIQLHDRKILLAMEETRTNYDDQKTEVEKLKSKLESQQKLLDKQKKDKEYLLSVTKADEARYQKLLAEARAEFEAILGILAGKGVEVKIGNVSDGQKIASIIQSESCSSSGPHLHFMVVKDKAALNPFSYLKSGVDYENCSSYSCGSADGDQFNPSGSWDWPINPPIKFNQGYGYTWAVQNVPWIRAIYSFHNGIDINSSSPEVKAVRGGILYRGNYSIETRGCALPYARIEHADGMQTYYLHVN